MLYDNYREKILRRAEVLRKLLRFAPLIISLLAAALAAAVTLTLLTGAVTAVNFTSSVEYGSAPAGSANAIFSDTYFEYSAKGAEQWSAEAPTLPGEYDVRIVSFSAFGGKRYKYIDALSVYPKKVEVTVASPITLYGAKPGESGAAKLRAELCDGDRLVCGGFIYEDPLSVATKIKPDASTIKIYNEAGEDITFAYDISTLYTETKVMIEPRELTILVEDASREYNGEEFSYSVYEVKEGSLLEGDFLQVRFEEKLTAAGTVINMPTISVVNSDGANVTHFYRINKSELGSLTVEKRPLHITTGSGEYEYDGSPHQCLEYSIDHATPLVEGHEIVVQGAFSVIDAGKANNSMAFSIKDKNGVDVTRNYSIIVTEGELSVKKRKITVTTESGTWMYDGMPHSLAEYTLEGSVFGSISSTLKNVTRLTQAGKVDNKFEITVYKGTADITSNYDITYVYGTLEVQKRPITVKTASASWVYDGEEHSSTTGINKNTMLVHGSLVSGHEITLDTNANAVITSIRDAGSVENRYTIGISALNQDVTANYDITYEYGTLTVSPRPITIHPKATSKIYDGKPLYAEDYEFAKLSLKLAKSTHKLEFTLSGSRTNVNDTGVSRIENVRVTEDGKDITHNYNIVTEEGYLAIIPRSIRITSASDEKVYDGKPLTNNNFFVVESSAYPLVEGHTIKGKATGSQTNIGKSDNTYNIEDVRVYSGRTDVTENYHITTTDTCGVLEVRAVAKITVTSSDASKVYDGKPLVSKNYSVDVSEGELLSGHRVTAVVSGSITKVGTAKNTVSSVTVTDRNGKDVSAAYEIAVKEGNLTVMSDSSGEEDTQTVFLKFRAPHTGTVYLKMQSYGNYNGKDWNSAVPYTVLMENKYNASYFTSIALKNAGYTSYNASVSESKIYMLPYYSTSGGYYKVPSDDVNVWTAGDMTSYTVPYFLFENYDNKLAFLKGKLGEYADEEREYREFVYDTYLDIDSETFEFMKNIIERNGFSADDGDIITKVASYIKNAANYNIMYDKQLDAEDNVAIAFLSKYKEGKCTHYATAATLLYRALGIPARYTEGFTVDAQSNKTVEVKNPGHAWVEIYIDGVGWVYVEVTGSDNSGGGSGGSGGTGIYSDEIVVQPTYCYKIYDGNMLVAENTIIETPAIKKLLNEGYTYSVRVSGQRVPIGKSESKVSSFVLYDPTGRDVTDEFEIKYKTGVLEVLARGVQTITVYLYETSKTYDGTPVNIGAYDYEIISGGEGISLSLDFDIPLTDAGEITLSLLNANIGTYVKYTVTKNGTDVTHEYRVQFDVFDDMDASAYVPIKIKERKITLTAASASKAYDGTELVNPGVSVTLGTLAPGDRLEASAAGSVTEIGTALNEVSSVKVFDKDGNDVTDNYEFTLNSGKLVVFDPE